MKRVLLGAAAAAMLTLALPAAAQFAKPEDAIKYRKAAFTLMQAHFGRVAAMASGKVPFDAKVAATNIEIASVLSKLPYDAFVPGTDKGNTDAKPEVWSESDKFRAAASKMLEEMTKLEAAGKTGKLDQIKPAFGAVSQACKNCHDKFRKD
jgi:cytochrome c556